MRQFAKLLVWGFIAPFLGLITASAATAQGDVGRIEPNRTELRELTGPPRPPETEAVRPQASLPSLLAIFAHPDDEITIAPVLSRIARSGSDVTIVFATSGDAGPGVSGLEMGSELAALRESEAQCAAFALRMPEPAFWRFGDGTLSADARTPSDPARDLAGMIESLIASEQPDIVMTWGPDGGYGHADHRMVSDIVTQIVQAMGEDRPRLLYSAIPAGEFDALPGFENWATTEPSLITDRIRYEPQDLEATRLAVDCYQSQFDAAARGFLPDALHQRLWRGTVYFREAFAVASEPAN